LFAKISTALFPMGSKSGKSTVFPEINPGGRGCEYLGEYVFEIVFLSGFEAHGGDWAVYEGGGGGIHVDVEANAYDNGRSIGVFAFAAF